MKKGPVKTSSRKTRRRRANDDDANDESASRPVTGASGYAADDDRPGAFPVSGWNSSSTTSVTSRTTATGTRGTTPSTSNRNGDDEEAHLVEAQLAPDVQELVAQGVEDYLRKSRLVHGELVAVGAGDREVEAAGAGGNDDSRDLKDGEENEKKKKRRKYFVFFVIIIIIGGGASVGASIAAKNKNKAQMETTSVSEAEDIIITSSPAATARDDSEVLASENMTPAPAPSETEKITASPTQCVDLATPEYGTYETDPLEIIRADFDTGWLSTETSMNPVTSDLQNLLKNCSLGEDDEQFLMIDRWGQWGYVLDIIAPVGEEDSISISASAYRFGLEDTTCTDQTECPFIHACNNNQYPGSICCDQTGFAADGPTTFILTTSDTFTYRVRGGRATCFDDTYYPISKTIDFGIPSTTATTYAWNPTQIRYPCGFLGIPASFSGYKATFIPCTNCTSTGCIELSSNSVQPISFKLYGSANPINTTVPCRNIRHIYNFGELIDSTTGTQYIHTRSYTSGLHYDYFMLVGYGGDGGSIGSTSSSTTTTTTINVKYYPECPTV